MHSLKELNAYKNLFIWQQFKKISKNTLKLISVSGGTKYDLRVTFTICYNEESIYKMRKNVIYFL